MSLLSEPNVYDRYAANVAGSDAAMSERTPITVRLVTEDIHADVEYELNLDAGTLSAEAAQPLWPAFSVFWVNNGPRRTAAEINAVLEAMTPHAQAMVDAFRAISEMVEEGELMRSPILNAELDAIGAPK